MGFSMKLIICALACVNFGAAVEVGPLGKVLQLLSQLEGKISKQGATDDKLFQEYTVWCKTGRTEKGFEIKTAKSEVDDLAATILKASSDIDAASTKLDEEAGSISQDEADLKAAAAIRAKENSEFEENEAELVKAVDMLDRAINIMQKKKGSASLMQYDTKNLNSMLSALNTVVDAASLSVNDKQALVSLVQDQGASEDDEEEMGAPAKAAYARKSGGIVTVIEDMRDKAQGKLEVLRKEEGNSKHNFAMLKLSLEDSIKADTNDMNEAKANKAAGQGTKAAAEGALSTTKAGLQDDEESLANLEMDCRTKANDHATTTAGRAEELKALGEAKKIISEQTGGAGGRTYGASFMQVDSEQHAEARSMISTRSDLANLEVVNVVRDLAKKEGSAALMQLAGRIASAIRYSKASGQDPFAKVRKMIGDMTSKLEAEAKSEASKKQFCDKELAQSKAQMEALNARIGKLSAKKDKDLATSVKLKGEVQELQAEIAVISKSQAEADTLRAEEHAAFAEAKADFEQGIEGVRKALGVLREVYDSSFLQQPEAPGTHSKASGAGNSIVGMLELVVSDFANGLSTAEVDEDSAASEYKKTAQMNKVSKAEKEKDAAYKTSKATGLDKSTAELSSDIGSSQTELESVMEYKKGIVSDCVAKPSTFEERQARREAEVEGLKEALNVLEGTAVFLQRKASLRGAAVAPHK